VPPTKFGRAKKTFKIWCDFWLLSNLIKNIPQSKALDQLHFIPYRAKKIGKLWSTNKKVIGTHVDPTKWSFYERLYFGPYGGVAPLNFFTRPTTPKLYFQSNLGRQAASSWALPHISSFVLLLSMWWSAYWAVTWMASASVHHQSEGKAVCDRQPICFNHCPHRIRRIAIQNAIFLWNFCLSHYSRVLV